MCYNRSFSEPSPPALPTPTLRYKMARGKFPSLLSAKKRYMFITLGIQSNVSPYST